jgi:ArsR family transcriptional regulator
MEMKQAAAALSALAHPGRLSVFRLLIARGPEGVAAGEIARALDIRANTLSAMLNVLSHARLIEARREGRSIIYAARYARMRALLEFLVGDCCGGAPEICAPLAETLRRTVCDCADNRNAMGDAA